jgi:hypothetical protein
VTAITGGGDRWGGPTGTLGKAMTDTTEFDAISEALAVIDEGLNGIRERALVSTDEVADLLLDVRTLLTSPPDQAPEPAGAGTALSA